MKFHRTFFLSLLFLSALLCISHAEDSKQAEPPPPVAALRETVELFSPQGEVKNIRQVSVRFSEQMVPFGDPLNREPFDIQCTEKGKGRWADARNWVYDFERDLPAGVVCEFSLKSDLRSLSGKTAAGRQKYSFSTGGPAIREAVPGEGSENISEDQIFIVMLDAEAVEESIAANVFCSIEGIQEKVGVRLIRGEEKENIAKEHYRLRKVPHAMVQCIQNFPNHAVVKLIWGRGVMSLSGVKTSAEQVLTFRTRDPFKATFRCKRENAKANCIPILPLQLNFSAPVSWESAKKIVLKGKGKTYKPDKASSYGYGDEDAEEGGEGPAPEPVDENTVYGVAFRGPFPENSSFSLELPKDLKDDAGRRLENKDRFPLAVKTDAFPPLAKFSARFGIIELNGDATLPVTLRNLEKEVMTRMAAVDKQTESPAEGDKKGDTVKGVKGRLQKLAALREEKIIAWLRKVAAGRREVSILKSEPGVREFSLPKPEGAKAYEVVGIPLKDPGFYVVEMESRILGASLLGHQAPLYVPTIALVTNLSAHFKWGRESSLVWVTTLDKAMPVKGADISIRDCTGKELWKGKTDPNGIAAVKMQLPSESELPRCNGNINHSEAASAMQGIDSGLFVFAKNKADMTFVHSNWDEGIEHWRFSLPAEDYRGPVKAHTIFDRSLLRAGETVHMKHLIRKHVMTGFSQVDELPKALLIQHDGSSQRYEFPLKWDTQGIAETEWEIPKDAKLGVYEVYFLKKLSEKKSERTAVGAYEAGDESYYVPDGWVSGSFRVEEFRVPLMRAIIQPPKEPLIRAKQAELDLFVFYLSGGGAGAMSVKLRSQVQRKSLSFPDYEDFIFANGEVREEVLRRGRYEGAEEEAQRSRPKIQTKELVLEKTGSLRTTLSDLPAVTQPHDVQTELEFRDPNGEVQTVSQRIPLWPSGLNIGIKPDSWAASKEAFKFHVAVLDLAGKPLADRVVQVDLFQKKFFSHRKRLVGGFYSYEHVSETKKLRQICEGRTDAKGLLICEVQSPVTGNVILQAKTADDAGNVSAANREVWIAGKGQWWFDVSDNDRIDLLPEKKRYEPGDTAKFQVRMPFREATALVTVEREGVIDTYVKKLSGASPVIEVPIRDNYAPNVFVSALIVRGRVSGLQPTAMVDLGKPAFKLGIAEINVGWKAHELNVAVVPEREVYKVREKARVRIRVKRADGKAMPKNSEVAIAAVDEGLLELMPNQSWKLLDAMMGRRGYEIRTATAQMQVVGKRHYGLKALPQGGGGGRQSTRELFETLLLWKGRVKLNDKGEASVEIPLNDSLSGFRIVAVANSGNGLFGTGQAAIRTTQEIMLLSGIPQVVREGDLFKAGFTVRNASERKMEIEVSGIIKGPEDKALEPITEGLAAGEAKDLAWEIKVPMGISGLSYAVSAKEKGGTAEDRIKVKQKVAEAVPVRIFQSTLAQIDTSLDMDVQRPKDAVAGKGGVTVSLKPTLSNGLGGVAWYMKQYPYTCMEQKTSKAIALRDEELWKKVLAELPAHLDGDGLVKYFPIMSRGSDSLTAYMLAISDEAGWPIPQDVRERMEEGLKGFVEGRVIRYSSLPTADLSIRKLSAIEALSRGGKAEPKMLGSIMLEPNLWPTSAVLDWTNLLFRVKDIPDREKRLKEAEQIIRSRLNFQGTVMGFSTENTDNLWWLMLSADVNAVKSVLTFLNRESWKEDMPRMVRGALGRQHRGYWGLTTANAWGVLAMEKFSKKFEAVAPTGSTSAILDQITKRIDWTGNDSGQSLRFNWPKDKELLSVRHEGRGKPWVMLQSLAAIPLKEPVSSGYKIKKSLLPIEQKNKGKWSKGDVIRVRLEIEAQADMTWVVVQDPIPSGSNILGTGLGRDSQIMTSGEKREGWVWPAFEERSFEAFRAYYEFVPKGSWTVEYTVRLNNSGTFSQPVTRAEALYAPEMFGELPNKKIEVGE
ncbi:MAG: alpha-2-macroglobulin [Nitrospirae bacterium]|nr:alpha-2-macroglobulin [Nitrospirota bacterium]